MSLTSLLSIARSALAIQQRSVDVASHNIANASTEGYRRQRLEISTAEPLRTPLGTLGRGVTSDGITRARDQFLDSSFRQESGLQGRFDTMKQLLGTVEGIVDDTDGRGLGGGLDELLNAFSDLANDPSNAAARTLVRESAQALVERFHGAAARLNGVSQDVLARMQDATTEANNFGTQIADLNRQIVASAKGVGAPDLEDRRDQLIDQLSQLVDVQVVQHANHSVGIVAGGALLVDGVQHATLEVRSLATGGYGVGVAGTSATVAVASGRLKALRDLSATTIPALKRQLDGFASAVVSEVNAVHRTGTTVGGVSNTDFFDASGLTADNIALAAPIRQSVAAIAAGTTGSPGDGSIALKLAALRSTGVASGQGQTLGEVFRGVVTTVATLTRVAEQGSASQDTLVASVVAQRSSVSDVSVDEEMISLIRGQQAYAAASKIVTAADEMMQSILDMV
jgi:flagellar hook-associated protein 1 FlgK